MVTSSRRILRMLLTVGFVTALSAQVSATENAAVPEDPIAADAMIAAPVVPADPAPATAAVAGASETSRLVSSVPAASNGLSVSSAMASAAAPAVKRPRAAANRPAYRTVASSGYDARGSSAWYGRHFVLMVGVAY
jgi:hypothetical protein